MGSRESDVYEKGKKWRDIKHLATSILIGLGLITLVSIPTYEIATNNLRLYRAGQHRLQYTVTPNERIVRKAVQQGELELAIYNVNFGADDAAHYNPDGLEGYLNKAFGRLGIRINLKYMDVNPYQDFEAQINERWADAGMEMPWSKEELYEYPHEFEMFVRSNEIDQWLDMPHKRVRRKGKPTKEPQLVVDNYMRNILGSKNYFDVSDNANTRADVVVVIADFRDSYGSGAMAYNQSDDSVYGESYVLIDNRDSNEKLMEQRAMASLLTHETGHKIGLGHPTVFTDVMSYARLSMEIIERVPQLAFGPESLVEWEFIKFKYGK